MTHDYLTALFGLHGRAAIVTGATGVLGGAIAHGLARAGAGVGVLGRRCERAEEVAEAIRQAGGDAIALPADVLDRDQLEAARDAALARWDRIDVLVNAACGFAPVSAAPRESSIFDLPPDGMRAAFDLNVVGALLPIQVFGPTIAEAADRDPGDGSIVNVSSVTAARAVSRVAGYAAAKAAVEQLTRWLAVELARQHGGRVRVNAIAPGFFLSEQNRPLLLDPDGAPTARGQAVLDHTPVGRFGSPEEIVAAALWLCGPGARFVTGGVVPVDGGLTAWSGI